MTQQGKFNEKINWKQIDWLKHTHTHILKAVIQDYMLVGFVFSFKLNNFLMYKTIKLSRHSWKIPIKFHSRVNNLLDY